VRKADEFTTFKCKCIEIWEPETPGTLRACSGLYRDCFMFYYISKSLIINTQILHSYQYMMLCHIFNGDNLLWAPCYLMYYFTYIISFIMYWLLDIGYTYVWNVIIYLLVFANLGRLKESVARVFVKFKQHTLWAVDHKVISYVFSPQLTASYFLHSGFVNSRTSL